MPPRHAIIVGAGLAGSLLAVSLARDGWRISLYERRPDPRAKGYSGGRSINLAVSARGIAGLASVHLDREILAGHAIPMRGRMIHAKDGSLAFQPYSKNPADAINSFSRGGLNLALINAAAREKNVSLHFNHPCLDVDFAAPAAIFATPDGSTTRATADLVLAADGAYSAVRLAMQKTDRFEYSQSYLSHGYKELHIPAISPTTQSSGTGVPPVSTQSPSFSPPFALDPNALHIWPRGAAMMIALPNTDGSFTNTLFWPFEGDHSFANLESTLRARRERDPAAAPLPADIESVQAFFSEHYPDAPALMPALAQDFFANPTGSLVTVRCSPWQKNGKVALLGDAAHAIVPFYGQGMNAAFEDVICLARLLREYPDQNDALLAYESERKPNSDAIADMALANFVEMRDSVASPLFRYRKKLEHTIHEMFPDRVFPQYNLVSFSTVPYTDALRRGNQLAAVLDRLLAQIPPDSGLDDPAWRSKVHALADTLLTPQARAEPVRVPEPAARLIDITPTISPRLKVWPGDTPPSRQVLCDLSKGDNITLSTLHATVHLGAHADGPNHYGKDAPSIEQMPLDRYFGHCQVLEAAAPRGARITPADVRGLDRLHAPIVLLRSASVADPQNWNEDFSALSVELVDDLAGRGVRTIGIDTPSVDLFSSKDLEAHHAILAHGIAILEGLILKHVPAGPDHQYELIALPLPLEGFDASPVRAVLRPLAGA